MRPAHLQIAARLVLWIVATGFAAIRLIGEKRAFGFLDDLPPSCPLKIFTGFPCAFCGMTHAFLHAVFFDWQKAFQANALSLPMMAGLLVLVLLLSLGVPLRVSPRFRAKLPWAAFGILMGYALMRSIFYS